MALSGNRGVDYYLDQELRAFGVAAGAHIFKGAFVGLKGTGYAHGLNVRHVDVFAGIAYEEVDNLPGVDGDVSVRVSTLGDFGFSLKGADVRCIGAALYASDDDTLAWMSTPSHYALYVGYIVGVPVPGKIILRLDPFKLASEKHETHCGIEVPTSLFPGR